VSGFALRAHTAPKRERRFAQVAQLVEQGTENPRVGGSIPPLRTTARADAQAMGASSVGPDHAAVRVTQARSELAGRGKHRVEVAEELAEALRALQRGAKHGQLLRDRVIGHALATLGRVAPTRLWVGVDSRASSHRSPRASGASASITSSSCPRRIFGKSSANTH
jgi:hypothetical protein